MIAMNVRNNTVGLGCALLSGFLLGTGVFAQSGDQAYFRVTGPVEPVIAGLDTNGVLAWSASTSGSLFQVERASDVSSGPWTPWTKVLFSKTEGSVKVHEFNPPSWMIYIPGGRFQMGDSQNDANVSSLAQPVHTAEVSPFYMDRFEFTNERMREVLQWAYDNGHIKVEANVITTKNDSTNVLGVLGKFNSEIILNNGVFSIRAGRDRFPAQYVSWFGSAALCNYFSLMKGYEPCYDLNTWGCDFSKNGFRLPTEAEWEFAARGGYEGLRFPWSHTNVITHSLANYRSDTNNWYDVSPTREYHPDYTNLRPRSSPVGIFAPNNYGLYDMAGNNWEWVWDWHARFQAGLQINPTGPASGSNRIFKGGSWFTKAERLTCAMRYPASPFTVFDDIGFRMIRPAR